MLYGRITGLVLSLFLPAFYRHVARSWGGIGILYLLLLFTLTWIPQLVKVHLSAQKFANEDFPKFAKEVPDISIRNGKVTSKVPQPFEAKDERGNVVFVLDTTGKINNIEQTKAIILVTDTKIWQRDPNNGQIQIHDIAQMQLPDFDFDAAWLQEKVDLICNWLAVSLFPFCLFGSMIRALIIMLLASIAGLIFNSAFNAKVTYGGLLRFGAVGMTLSVYISTGLWIAGIDVPFWFFISLALTIGYVALGTYASIPSPDEAAALDDRVPRRSRRERHPEDDDDYEDENGYGRRKADDGHGRDKADDGGFKEAKP